MSGPKDCAPGRGDGAGAGELHETTNHQCKPDSQQSQQVSLALPDALGRAQYETQCAVVELLTHGETRVLRSRILNAEAALGSARWIVDYTLTEGGTP